jgi:hypothetical protein
MTANVRLQFVRSLAVAVLAATVLAGGFAFACLQFVGLSDWVMGSPVTGVVPFALAFLMDHWLGIYLGIFLEAFIVALGLAVVVLAVTRRRAAI